MPLSFDTAHRLAMADIRATMTREGRTVMNGEDVQELRRIIGLYTDNRPASHGAEDDIEWSATGLTTGGGTSDEWCR